MAIYVLLRSFPQIIDFTLENNSTSVGCGYHSNKYQLP